MFTLVRQFCVMRLGELGAMSILEPNPLCLQQIRGRKRALKKPMSRQERLLRRQKREEKEAARKQYSFMERIKIRRMKSLLSPSQLGPGRYDAETETELPTIPACNVYIQSEVQIQLHSIENALKIQRSLQRPEIYNNPNAPVKLRLELNMNTEKASKMVTATDEIVPLPNVFKHNEKRSILAFAVDQENQELAVQAGAEIGVGVEMIKKILKGQFRVDDYDFCVAHTSMAGLLAPLRGILRTQFPTKLNGAMDDNMVEVVNRFKDGVKLSIKGDPVYPMWGLCEPVVGNLAMTNQQLEENIATIIAAVCKHRSPTLGPFINRALLTIIPSHNFIPINVTDFMPIATVEELEKIEKRKPKKKKQKEQEKAAAATNTIKEDDYLLSLM